MVSVFSIGIIFHIKLRVWVSVRLLARENPACSAVRFLMRCLLAEHLYHAMSAVIVSCKRTEPFIANSEDLHPMQLSEHKNFCFWNSVIELICSWLFPCFRQHHPHFTCRFWAGSFQLFDAKNDIILYSVQSIRTLFCDHIGWTCQTVTRLSPIPPCSGLLREYDSSASLQMAQSFIHAARGMRETSLSQSQIKYVETFGQ